MPSSVASQRPEPETPLLKVSPRDNDEPVSTSAEDRLDFVERYAVPLARRIASKESDAPLTIGIYGSWGSGKTSLMNLVGGLVTGQDQVAGFTPESPCFVVRLNAWKYSGEQTLWRVIVRAILDALLNSKDRGQAPKDPKDGKATDYESEMEILREALYNEVTRKEKHLKVNWPRLAGGLVSASSIAVSALLGKDGKPAPPAIEFTLAGAALVGGGIAAFGSRLLVRGNQPNEAPKPVEKLLEKSEKIAEAFEVVEDVISLHHRVEYLEQFSDSFQEIITRYLAGRRLVLFIDDLDRCLPEKMVDVLEAIKLFLGVKNTVFVIGVDVPVLARGIEVYYSRQGFVQADPAAASVFNGMRYLEKIVQFPFHIPPLELQELGASKLLKDLASADGDARWLEVGIRGFGGNPRAVKRFARIYRHRREVISSSSPEALQGRELHLAKLVVLQEHHRWSSLVDLVARLTVSSLPELLRQGPLGVLERAAVDPKEYQVTFDKTVSAVPGSTNAQLGVFVRDDDLMQFLRIEPMFAGEPPVDPLPLIRLGGGHAVVAAPAPAPAGLDQIVNALLAPGAPDRANALGVVRGLRPEGQRDVVEQLLARVSGLAEKPQPDSNGLPAAIDALRACCEMGIAPELITSRVTQFSELLQKIGASGDAKESRQALVNLLAAIQPAKLETKLRQPFRAAADEPLETGGDLFGMQQYVETVARLIQGSTPPLVAAIYGGWGSGKTAFLGSLARQLETATPQKEKATEIIRLDAHEAREAGPIVMVLNGLTRVFPELREKLKDVAVTPGAYAQLEAPLSAWNPGLRVVVMVDNLDSATSAFQYELLEAVSTAFRQRYLLFVIAANREILTKSLDTRLADAGRGGETGDAYLERLVQIPFNIPRLGLAQIDRALSTEPEAREALGPLIPYLDPNPRKIKQLVDTLRRILKIAKEQKIDSRLLAALLVMRARWPAATKSSQGLQLWLAVAQNDLPRRDKVLAEMGLADANDLLTMLMGLPRVTEGEFRAALEVLEMFS